MSTGFQSLEHAVRFYADLGVEHIYIKILAANDNSKNQVYFGPGFKALTLFPLGEIHSDPSEKNPIFKAAADFLWVGDDQSLCPAPTAQVILYPQYPEIRFSGFLKDTDKSKLGSIRELMTSRTVGRVLFLGGDRENRIIGSVFASDSEVAKQINAISKTLPRATEIFLELGTSAFLGKGADSRTQLLEELCRIHRLGWINSKRLDGSGNTLPCNAPQCGGYTLEAELGITPNGRSEPDFMGWEVKQYGGSVLTLMTPEPTGGFYVEKGVEQFIRTFGYPDKLGRADRWNFGGTHYCGKQHATTGLTLQLLGYDTNKHQITDQHGGIALSAGDGTLAAFWGFASVLDHWKRKHRNAVYVPGEHRTAPANQYRYDAKVLLCEGTDPLFLTSAIVEGMVYYDPGIKLEEASSSKPAIKRRSQFRVKLKDIGRLYDKNSIENVLGYCS